MRRLVLASAAIAAALAVVPSTVAARGQRPAAATIAVFGDLPYSDAQIAGFDRLAASVNADPDVSLALHLGDIKSGSTPCTDARLQLVRDAFDRFDDPLVYTPGDNEWTDCHRPSAGGWLPVERLALLRSMFFPAVGRTLGREAADVESQGHQPGYGTFVENVRWRRNGVMFATVDVPGSNDDAAPWSAPWSSTGFRALQAEEVAARTDAVVAWLRDTFRTARDEGARAVVIGQQADMWDTTAPLDQLTAFAPIVQELARDARAFRRPVLLLNGDSHVYGVDRPLADPATAFNVQYGIASPVPNLTRLTVQGSTIAPSSWVRLRIDPRAPVPWSFETVEVSFT